MDALPASTQVLAPTLRDVSLDDKYVKVDGVIYMTGIQALVRLPLLQKDQDRSNGLNTAGYISGYRGSPLGTFDKELTNAKEHLKSADVVFVPGVNEDLAATAIWGTQQAESLGEGKFEGVFALWYGKGPGVDRSGDAFRHANLAGTSQNGGVLVLTGDDHTCESSTTCHQSDFALLDAMIPILSPAGVQEILEFGLLGWAMSRYSGCWVGMKCVKDIADAAGTVRVPTSRPSIRIPVDFDLPADGVNLRQPDHPHAQEYRLVNYKLEAAKAFALHNDIDVIKYRTGRLKLGIVTHGKNYLDVLQALDELGIDDKRAADLGLGLYKVGMTWPMEPIRLREFARGVELLIVVEEKRPLLEAQIKEILFSEPNRPAIIGKRDETGSKFFPIELALDAVLVASNIGSRIAARCGDADMATRAHQLSVGGALQGPALNFQRRFYFCSGCPHNRSTTVPAESRAYAGIGCSWMAQAMDRATLGFTQMGGEGLSWVGEAPFSKRSHVFQNMGDGTYFHSGLLAIRAAVAAKTNITFKILFNDAVAMTGGQKHDGPLTPQIISWQVFSEGVGRVAVVSDDIEKYNQRPTDGGGVDRLSSFAPDVTIHHRDELDSVQQELRKVAGTSILIFDQMCAAEKRRRRKRGTYPDTVKRLVINESVCEGCGDCGVQSNCISLVPKETPLGRKRQIDQSSCNYDFSCLKGFCPSFVTIYGGDIRRPMADADTQQAEILVEPVEASTCPELYSVLVAGIGGTGVVTIGAILGMAAHLAGRGGATLDMAGLAQKGGSVWSHIRIGRSPESIKSVRLAHGSADLVLGCDLLVTASDNTLATVNSRHTRVVVNNFEVMPGDFTRNADLQFPRQDTRKRIEMAAGHAGVHYIDATRNVVDMFGNSIAGNTFLLGYAFQQGLIPLPSEAILKAIELNGTAAKMNARAFLAGRQHFAFPEQWSATRQSHSNATTADEMSVSAIIAHRMSLLKSYQDEKYAARYRDLVARVMRCEAKLSPSNELLTRAVAINYAKLLAYKDEYEVARLYSGPAFKNSLQEQFASWTELKLNLAPPWLSRRDRISGKPRKSEYGAWIFTVFELLAKLKWLRATRFDPFGYAAERKQERALIEQYEADVELILTTVDASRYATAIELASIPDRIRGFGYVKEQHLAKVAPDCRRLRFALRCAPISAKSIT